MLPALCACALLAAPPAITAKAGMQEAPPPAWRITLEEQGLYRLRQEDLVKAGFDPSADAATLKISHRSAEVAIRVLGGDDGRLDPGDAILFYGESYSDRFTDINAYRLTYGGSAGKRMLERDATPAAAPIPSSFTATVHAEQNTRYWQSMPGGTEDDRHFWGSRIGPAGQGVETFRDYPVTLDAVAPSQENGTVRVRLKGYTATDHRTRLWLNGQPLGERAWTGQEVFEMSTSAPPSLLKSGENTVRVEALPSGASVDQILVNWMEIEYRAAYRAASDRLVFSAPRPGRFQFAVSGFTKSAIDAYDLSDPTGPIRLVGGLVENTGDGYRLRVEDASTEASRYFALAPGAELAPLAIVLDSPSSLRVPDNGADYIVITHESFAAAAIRLAAHRQAQGLRTAVVRIQDVYDEFSGGIFSPVALRDFLRYTYYSWEHPPPKYIVLLGDANQDYKDSLGNGTRNFVPSYSFGSSQFGEVSSDNWLASLDGPDPLPDVHLGRLAAQTLPEANLMVSKLIEYDRQGGARGGWLLVADDDEPSFTQLSDSLAAVASPRYPARKIYAATYGPGDMQDDIVNGINAGAAFVNYVGHGEHNAWGLWRGNSERMFGLPEVSRLDNLARQPIVTVGDCLNGFFAGPSDNPSLAEGLQRHPGGGAVAVWAPTGYGSPLGHRLLLEGFYEAIFDGNATRIGDATTLAKLAAFSDTPYWSELIMTYVLFGDPATEVRVDRDDVYLPAVSR